VGGTIVAWQSAAARSRPFIRQTLAEPLTHDTSESAPSAAVTDGLDAVLGHTPLYLSETRLADASSVGWARKSVAELAVAAGMRGERLEDVRLAVSEAVTNTVAYAYDGASGDVHVIAAVVSGELWIVIADDGMGMRRRPTEIRGLGLGLGLMARVSDALTILTRSSGGVEVQMRFRL
jgi:stage II sporulation protein AB (anti-sigma F factor)